jgi:hypothetical protein
MDQPTPDWEIKKKTINVIQSKFKKANDDESNRSASGSLISDKMEDNRLLLQNRTSDSKAPAHLSRSNLTAAFHEYQNSFNQSTNGYKLSQVETFMKGGGGESISLSRTVLENSIL